MVGSITLRSQASPGFLWLQDWDVAQWVCLRLGTPTPEPQNKQQSPLPSPSLCLMCDLEGNHRIPLSLRLPTIKWRSHVKLGELWSTAGDMDGDLVSPGEFYGLSRTNKISAKHPT